MRLLQILACLGLFLTLSCASRQDNSTAGHVQVRGKGGAYELYSWRDEKDGWAFSLLPHVNRQYTAEEVFDRRSALRGVDRLEREMRKLAGVTVIFWVGQSSLGEQELKSTERLTYPPAELQDEVRWFATTLGVRVEILP